MVKAQVFVVNLAMHADRWSRRPPHNQPAPASVGKFEQHNRVGDEWPYGVPMQRSASPLWRRIGAHPEHPSDRLDLASGAPPRDEGVRHGDSRTPLCGGQALDSGVEWRILKPAREVSALGKQKTGTPARFRRCQGRFNHDWRILTPARGRIIAPEGELSLNLGMSYSLRTYLLAAIDHQPLSPRAAIVVIALLSLGWAALWLAVTDLSWEPGNRREGFLPASASSKISKDQHRGEREAEPNDRANNARGTVAVILKPGNAQPLDTGGGASLGARFSGKSSPQHRRSPA